MNFFHPHLTICAKKKKAMSFLGHYISMYLQLSQGGMTDFATQEIPGVFSPLCSSIKAHLEFLRLLEYGALCPLDRRNLG